MAAGRTYTPIAKQTAGSGVASITFSSIPSGYTDLVIIASMATTRADTSEGIAIQFNSDTGTNYSVTLMNSTGSGATSSKLSNYSFIMTRVDAATSKAGAMTPTIININNYANTSTYKTALARFNEASNGYGVGAIVGLWRNTAAITSVTLATTASTNFIPGSTFTLYGIAAA